MRVEGSQLTGFKTDGTVNAHDFPKPAVRAGETTGELIKIDTVRQENKEISFEDLQKKVKQLNDTAKALDCRFKIAIHKETNRIMIEVFRKDNNELIAEIPPRRVLDVIARIEEEMGLLVDTRA